MWQRYPDRCLESYWDKDFPIVYFGWKEYILLFFVTTSSNDYSRLASNIGVITILSELGSERAAKTKLLTLEYQSQFGPVFPRHQFSGKWHGPASLRWMAFKEDNDLGGLKNPPKKSSFFKKKIRVSLETAPNLAALMRCNTNAYWLIQATSSDK